jgi:hypothetical protein
VWSRTRRPGPRQQAAEDSVSDLRRDTDGLPAGFVIGLVVVAVASLCFACAAAAVLARTWLF